MNNRDWIDVSRTEDLMPHHVAWLFAHPERSPEWLKEHTRDGFDVHHIDGDHSNNDPNNLILTEHRDHFMLHASKRPTYIGQWTGPREKTLLIGALARSSRPGRTWFDVGLVCSRELKMDIGGPRAMFAAKIHAQHNNLEWPIQDSGWRNKHQQTD